MKATPLLLICALSILPGCAVVSVADAAISVTATAVKAGASVVGAGVDVASAGVKAVVGSDEKKE